MEKFRTVSFRWSTKHGKCYDCGYPAAFLNSDMRDRGYKDEAKRCAVCAANDAAFGERIEMISSGTDL